MTETPVYRCPVCGLPLEQVERAYRCENRHSFDVAREGYVNLLLANQKKSRDGGDSREMLTHRREFLDAGYYAPLRDRVAELITGYVAGVPNPVVLESGCGEGYYLGGVMGRTAGRFIGVDISKPGVAMAAKRCKGAQVAVGTAFDLPVLDGVADVAFSIFAPYLPAEFARVLKPGGLLITVKPDAGHLHSLRAMIYDEVTPYEPDTNDDLEIDFERVFTERVAFPFTLRTSADVGNLYRMTPFYWHSSAEVQARVLALDALETTAAFRVAGFVTPVL